MRMRRALHSTTATCLLVLASLPARAWPAAISSIHTLIGEGNLQGLFRNQVVLSGPTGVTLDANGNLYVVEVYPPRLLEIGRDSRITVIAGTGVPGSAGDGGPAAQAQFREPSGLAADGQGNLFVADAGDQRVRRIDRNGTISTYVGPVNANRGGTTASAATPSLVQPVALALDGVGNLFIADAGASQIFRVDTAGVMTAIAGQAGKAGFSGDGGPATAAVLNHPAGVALGADHSIYIADGDNGRVRKITPDGIIRTIAGGGQLDRAVGRATELRLDSPTRLFVESSGSILVTQPTVNRVRRIDPNGVMTVVAGNGAQGFAGESGIAAQSPLNYPLDVVVDPTGALLVTETSNNRIRSVSRDGTLTTFAGGVGASGLTVDQTRLISPSGGVTDSKGNRYVADSGHHRILRISPAGLVDVYAGRGAPGFAGDNGPATLAGFGSAEQRYTVLNGLAIDSQDNLYVADALNYRIRRISRGGTITTVAGTGTPGFSGDNGPAINAQVGEVRKLAVDAADNLYFVDAGNHRVREVDTRGTITTVAGDGTLVFGGDGATATKTGLPGPDGLFAAADGTLYITDIVQPRVYHVDRGGVITSVAGTGVRGGSGDGTRATTASVDYPEAVVRDAAGNLYLAERYLNTIRRIDPAGIITTVAGNGQPESTGDGGPAAMAGVWRPVDLGLDPAGSLIVSELGHSHRVRLIEGLP
jgi:sugar lactone lactonase YvrE